MGRACSLLFAREGAAVFAVDVNEAGLAETASLIVKAGGKIETARCDVRSRDACFDAVDRAVGAFGQLDVLLNIAGVAPMEHMLDVTEEGWNRTVGINLSGVFFLSQAAVPHLLKTAGNIVNVASNAGVMGQAYTVAYCATKGGVVQITRAMAMEFMKQPIRVNCVCPSGTKTGITSNASMPDDIDVKLLQRFVGFRGMSEADEIAEAIAYLASDAAKSVHGTIFNIDNGVTAG
jgi:NAD(P)-dependent dehydrogenase (short-subunit alcohol dehydrogenase family)